VGGDIFLVRGDDELVPMVETAYDSEDVLQALIARFPDLLAGDQLPGDVPRRWLLIGREAALPAEEDGAGRWSVDHLFLDQDAVPTLVEVKRSSDTRIRREVIGQMLDYAANAVLYWPIDALRLVFERRCETEERDSETELVSMLGDLDRETYWAQAAANLKAGRIRLVFVADQIPRELRRVVEFLNEQMSAEVLAIEVKQYVGEGDVRTLVPRVIGQTAATAPPRTSVRWDEPSFFTELERRRGPAEATVARKLLAWARANMTRVTWGKGRVDGSLVPVLEQGGQPHLPFAIYTDGRVEIQFLWLTRPPFDSSDVRREFLARLNQIPGVQLPEDAITRRPRIQLSVLAADPTAIEGLIHALDWFRDRVVAGSPG
jgi:uncharacterized DUF497 family protein